MTDEELPVPEDEDAVDDETNDLSVDPDNEADPEVDEADADDPADVPEDEGDSGTDEVPSGEGEEEG